MTRAIYLEGPERWLTLGQYVEAVRRAKSAPDAEFTCGFDCWWPCTGREVVAQFRAAMHARISDGVPYAARGFKLGGPRADQ